MPEPHPFRRAVESHDLDLMRDALREDVVFHSPILFRPFEGRDAALHVLSRVVEIFTDFSYSHELSDANTVCLRFHAKVGDREIEGIDFLELDDEGRIAKLTVLMRPMTAVTEFSQLMAAALGTAA